MSFASRARAALSAWRGQVSPLPWLGESISAGGAIFPAATVVSPTTALTLTAVYRACTLLADATTAQPPALYRQQPGGGRSRVTDTPTARTLATLAHHDAVLGCLRSDGFAVAEAGHAIAVLDAFTYGFAVQEANLPLGPGEWEGDLAASIVAAMPAGRYPHLVELATERVMQPGYDFGDEFDFGLDLVLAGLAMLPGPAGRG